MELFAFYLGIACVYTHSSYAVLALIVVLYLKQRATYIGFFCFGLVWSLGHQFWVFNTGLPDVALIPKAEVQGVIQSIPIKTETKTTFDFLITTYADKPVSALTHLSCYRHCPNMQLGEHWSFLVKLKRPRNLGNPGAFDYVGYLHAYHIAWIGYIRKGRLSESVAENSLLRLRSTIAKKLEEFPLKKSVLGIIEAQTLGLTTHIDKALWDCFRETGTTHLMVISGSHILLVGGFFYLLFKRCWSLSSRLCLFFPAQQAAGLIAFIISFFYALLTGFSIPVQRAFLAYALFCLRSFFARPLSTWQVWRYALCFILLFEPHAVLFPGFYFSFFAVGLLLAAQQYLQCNKYLKILLMQLVCLVGLLPLSLFWFSYGALNGFFANVIAIPWVSYIIVPLSLLSLLLSYCFSCPQLFTVLSWAIEGLLGYLYWVKNYVLLNFSLVMPSVLHALCLSLGIFIFVLIPNKRLMVPAFIFIITSFKPKLFSLPEGDVLADILDVGQGLSVVVHTQNHTLVYDTGMRFYQGSDMAEMAILPYLAKLGKKEVDIVVISHPDLDHRGGLESLEKGVTIGALLVDDPAFYKRGISCHHYSAWDWDGVHFQFLPILTEFSAKNNHSCILKITTKAGAILLTGDIEQLAEEYLMMHYPKILPARFLLVPHHGSKTSSSRTFVHRVAPDYAVISSGFDNRYHFPHKQTLETYQSLHIPLLNTADYGMVRIQIGDKWSVIGGKLS